MEKKIKIVGCGPGSPEYLTPEACLAVQEAAIVMGAQKLLDLFPDSTAVKEPLDKNLSLTIDRIGSYIENHVVAVLVSGDPGIYSLAKLVINRYGKDSCEVIPGISSVQVAFARLGLDWSDSRMISAHKGLPELDLALLFDQCGKLAIFSGSSSTGPWIASFFRGADPQPLAIVCQNLTLAEERVDVMEAHAVEKFKFDSSSIIILLDRRLHE